VNAKTPYKQYLIMLLNKEGNLPTRSSLLATKNEGIIAMSIHATVMHLSIFCPPGGAAG